MIKKQFLLLLFGAAVCTLPTSYAMEEQAHEYEETAKITETTPGEHPLKDNDIVTIQLTQNVAKINQQPFGGKEHDETMHIIEGNDVDTVKERFTVPYKVIKQCTTLRNFIVKTSDNTGEITFSEDQAHNFELLTKVLPLLEILADETLSKQEKEQKLIDTLGKTTKQELLDLLDFSNYFSCQPLYDFFIKLMHQKLQNLLFKEQSPSLLQKTYDFVRQNHKDKRTALKKALKWIQILENTDHYEQFFDFTCNNLKNQNLNYVKKQLQAHTDWVNSVCFSPDGNYLASASRDYTIKLWNLDGSLVHTLTGHTRSVKSVCFSPDGNYLASASGDYTIKLWNLDGSCVHTLTGHTVWFHSV